MFPVLGEVLCQRYRLDRVVGEGATSRVFAGYDQVLHREVAIKVLIVKPGPEPAESTTKAKDEARLLAQLKHPHIVAIHDVGDTASGAPFLVMELVSGLTLEEELQRTGVMAPERALALLLPVMGALSCAHDRGIVHRDIKPQNMALEGIDSKKPRAKLFDFGVAQSRANVDGEAKSAIGTPAYMAPEQARAAELGPYTDVWALGVVLYRALSGHLPFDGQDVDTLLTKIARERAPSLTTRYSAVPMRLALAIDRALERQPQRRYPDARAFAQALVASAQQDGVKLPSDPDPIGLPDYATWLRSASIESTAQSSSKRAVPAAIHRHARVRRARMISAFALVVLALVAAWWLKQPGSSAPTNVQHVPERAPISATSRVVLEEQAASAAPPAAIVTQSPLAPTVGEIAPSPTKTKARKARAAARPSAPQAVPASTEAARTPALMMDWDG